MCIRDRSLSRPAALRAVSLPAGCAGVYHPGSSASLFRVPRAWSVRGEVASVATVRMRLDVRGEAVAHLR
eukprot:4071626-Alexandrium_andersonii.AAC.1